MKLDLGCGDSKFPDYIGVDIRRFKGTQVLCDATKGLPFKTGTFDGARSSHVLEHINRDDYDNIWRELGRVLKPGSVVLISFPYWTHETAIIFGHISLQNEEMYERQFREGALIAMFFELLNIEFTYVPEYQNKPKDEKEWARKHLMNVVSEMTIVMRRR